MTPILAALAAELPATREDDVAIHAYVREARGFVDKVRAMDGTPKHAWTDADARMASTGHYDAHEGGGWQPCTGSIPVAASTARDDAAREEQAAHRAAVVQRIHDTGEALIAYAEAHGG
jgi:hypothetical protein